MVFRGLVVLLFLHSFSIVAAVSDECRSALKTLFSESVSVNEASSFLKVQGDLTLHRLAWAYLKAQEADEGDKLENTERTILTLLDEKYTSTDPEFIKARNLFEAQPLSRTALAEIGPYLKEVLSKDFGEDAKPFVLNASDLKILHALAKYEKKSETGIYDAKMLDQKSTKGMLNFAKVINSSYKTSTTKSEKALNTNLKLQGLEKTIGEQQDRINGFVKDLTIPTQCQELIDCEKDDVNMTEIIEQNENVQDIFWESLSDKLESDDMLLDNLTYGEIWLRTGPSSPARIDVAKNASVKTTTTIIAAKTKTTPTSPVKEFYSTASGYFIEDPVAVIVKDNPKRDSNAWRGFDDEFLEKMSDAIIGDDKVFEMNGRIYSRKTGKSLSNEAAMSLLPPKKSADLSAKIKSQDSKFVAKQTSAMVNGEESFIYGSGLYGIDGKALSPEVVVAQEMSRKKEGSYSVSRYQGMDEGYLIARADGLKNDRPHFKYKNQVYDSETGRNLSSPFRSLATTQDVKINKERRVNYQNFSDKETIVNFHLDHPQKDGCQYYAIIDKKNADVSVYNLSGTRVFHKEVLIGVKASDEKTKWTEYNDRDHLGSYTTGAGAFKVGEPKTGDYYSKNYSNNILQIEGQSVFAIHQVPNNLGKRYQSFGTGKPEDRRVSQGCVNMKQNDFISLKKWIRPSCELYVLPEENNNKFIVKDGRIELVSTTKVENKSNYNYSKPKSVSKAIDIRIIDPSGQTKASIPFVKALEDEKPKLMKLFNLSNDEYNDLASLSYGIMGNESDFGRSKRYWIKEHDQGDVIIAKAAKRLIKGKNPFDKSVLNTSRGFTQIKELPEGAWRKAYPEINKTTLGDPKNAAVSTIAYLAGAVRTLRNIAAENEKDPRKVRITKENMIDYLGYIYQGRKGALKSVDDPANADFNTYVQSLRKHMNYIEIAQDQ
jgi:hypothetical protein